jgi:pimeloyl-ACP methyl ester carboxylesterase
MGRNPEPEGAIRPVRRQARAVDGFRLAYDRSGDGQPVILLHGWPGDRHDYRDVVAELGGGVDVIVPDLRGFGESDKHAADPRDQYDAAAQARSIIALLDELDVDRVVVGGYDVGSRVAQALAHRYPHRIRGLALSPPLPGVGRRILEPSAQPEYWYQAFHQSPLVEHVLDGKPEAVLAYLSYFWHHWSGPDYRPREDELRRLAILYGAPGAMVASVNYYRAGAGTVAQSLGENVPVPSNRVSVPTIVLWPGRDALVQRQWADRLDEYFADLDFRVVESGHFTPVEAPCDFAAAVTHLLDTNTERSV